MKVFVTGGEGFVGRHLIDRLVRAGHDVAMTDIRHPTPVVDGTQGPDLANEDVAIRQIQNGRFDVVVHLASSVSTPGSLDRPLETFRNTVRTAVHVLEGCRLTNTPCIVTSSVKARDGMTPYGAAKRMVETWAEEMIGSYDLPVVINRPGTIYGPGQEGSPESGWIAWFLKAKAEGLKVTINGNGKQVRDLLYVEDYVDLLALQVDDPTRYVGNIWDVGGGEKNAVSVNGMVKHLDLDYEHGPPRAGDAPRYVGRNLVPGWEPRTYWKETESFR